MTKQLKSSSLWMLVAGLTAGLLVGVGMMVGTIAALSWSGSGGNTASLPFAVPERVLHAAAGDAGGQMAMATGEVYEDAEGVFVLDFLTGDLYCFVPDPRNLKNGFTGVFKTNVVGALGVEKGRAPDYVMVTGEVSPIRGAGISVPANTICYVADSNSGRVAAYSLLFNKTAARSSTLQKGELVLLSVVPARPNVEQEQ